MAERAELWERVDELVSLAPGVPALRHHRVELLEARRQRDAGLMLSPELRSDQRLAALRALAVPHLLRRMRAAADGPLVLMKGPEAAASFARPECRPYKDLDILSTDPEATQAALIAAGFTEVRDAGSAPHHMFPLVWPGVPVPIEIHSAPHFVRGLRAPTVDALLHHARPSRTGVAGIEGLQPAAHAVLLAVHGWVHGPLERLGHLVDVAAVLAEADRPTADALAVTWGCERLWRATTAAIDGILLRRGGPLPVRTWARHLRRVREPRVLETYVARMAAPVWALPPAAIAGGVGAEVCRTVLPYETESWRAQLARSRQALTHTFRPVSEYRERPTAKEHRNDPVPA